MVRMFLQQFGWFGLVRLCLAIEIYRHGRTGKSKLIGLGKYDLSRYYSYALPSLYAAWQGGAIAILTGMFGWWLAYLVWLQTVEPNSGTMR